MSPWEVKWYYVRDSFGKLIKSINHRKYITAV